MLITPAYAEEQRRLHASPDYGSGSHRHAHLVAGIARLEGCRSVLDYGCGKGTIGAILRARSDLDVREYDPAIAGKDHAPQPADLVTCLDVMEHIEPPCFDDVLADLRRLSTKRLFVDVATKFTKSRWLSDGRNSHLIVEENEWWRHEITRRGFKVIREWNTGVRAYVALMKPI